MKKEFRKLDAVAAISLPTAVASARQWSVLNALSGLSLKSPIRTTFSFGLAARSSSSRSLSTPAAVMRCDSSLFHGGQWLNEDEQFIALVPKAGFHDVAGVFRINKVELRIGEAENAGVIHESTFNSSVARRVFVHTISYLRPSGASFPASISTALRCSTSFRPNTSGPRPPILNRRAMSEDEHLYCAFNSFRSTVCKIPPLR